MFQVIKDGVHFFHENDSSYIRNVKRHPTSRLKAI